MSATRVVLTLGNPRHASGEVLPMCPVRSVTYVSGRSKELNSVSEKLSSPLSVRYFSERLDSVPDHDDGEGLRPGWPLT